MTQETLVAVFDSLAHAGSAVADLTAAGIASSDIECHSRDALAAPVAPAGQKNFWSTLFGGETTTGQNTVYDRTVRAGGEVVTVLLHDIDRDADRVMTILEKYTPVDVNERAASYATTGAATGEQTIQLSEERLAVGKRQVSRGTTRLHRFVRTMAVEETITLRDETVSVERRVIADGAVAGPDAFTDQVIEMTEIDEVAVVAKTARVHEEIVLHKEVAERVETVRETLRREDVEIEKIPATSTTGTVETARTASPQPAAPRTPGS